MPTLDPSYTKDILKQIVTVNRCRGVGDGFLFGCLILLQVQMGARVITLIRVKVLQGKVLKVFEICFAYKGSKLIATLHF